MEPESSAEQVTALVRSALEAHQTGKIAEAESLYRKVLGLDPSHPDALHFLGLLVFERGDQREGVRLVEQALTLVPGNLDVWSNLGNLLSDIDPARAEACFRRVVERDPSAVPAHGNLATLLMSKGDLAGAATHLRAILAVDPHEQAALRLLAKCLCEQRDFEGSVAAGRRALECAPGDALLRKAVNQGYFLWFDAVDRDRTKAAQVLDAWRAFDPSDPVAAHMQAALLRKDVPPRASDAYLERHFDEFASQFEAVLGRLQYRTPQAVADAIKSVLGPPNGSLDVVDLGCGTGLVGPLVRGFAKTLVGIDLSGKMLDEARARGVYDELRREEITEFLARHPDSFDLAICIDTLIYFGALEEFLRAAAGALRSGGRLFFTVERLDGAPEGATFSIHAAGRYAHTRRYAEEVLSASGFVVESIEDDTLRTEYGKPVDGLLVSVRRP